MDNGVLVVNFGHLQQASMDIQKALNALDSQLDELECDASPLVASWEGAAKEAYAIRQARWRTAANDLRAILRDIKIAVDESACDYMNTEKKATGLFQ